MRQSNSLSTDLKKLLRYGAGVGVEIRAQDLEIAVARVRPGKVAVLGRITIRDFASRPAAEWGAEYASFLKASGVARLSATVLLPRRDVIVRHVSLPGVASKDIPSAIRFQLDSLHPYGESDIVWGWSPLSYGAVLVGIARRDTVDRYNTLFQEAGIAVAAFTFSAAAIHAAVRLGKTDPPADGFVALSQAESGAVEVYGESQSRPVYSAEFHLPEQRAAGIASSELRLPPGAEPVSLQSVLPVPVLNSVENNLSRNAMPYTAALAGACPWISPSVNVLPPEYRRSNSRAVFIPSIVLGVLALLAAGGGVGYSSWSDKQYLAHLNQEMAKLEPQRRQAEALDKQAVQTRARSLLLEEFRKQTRKDLDALNELTRLIEPPAWTSMVDVQRDTIRLGGEAPAAAPLPQILDGSPLFERSEILSFNRGAAGEGFQIRTNRRAGK